MVGEIRGPSSLSLPTTTIEMNSVGGSENSILLRIDSEGTLDASYQIVHDDRATYQSFDLDSSGNIYLSSAFQGNVSLPTGDVITSIPESYEDAFLMKLILAPGISVSPSTGLTTTEQGGVASFDLMLDTQPTADVTITLTSSDSSEGTVSPATVTFTPSSWNVPQSVVVTGVDDGIEDGDVGYTIVTGACVQR